MDRTSFLRAQPYLFPLQDSSSWPPPLPVETSERNSCRRETLLTDSYYLSIEPIGEASGVASSQEDETYDQLSQESIHRSVGPAFFVNTKTKDGSNSTDQPCDTAATHKNNNNTTINDFDPAMCPLEVSLQTSNVLLPSHASPMLHRHHHHALAAANFRSRGGFLSPTAYHKLLRKKDPSHHHLAKASSSSPQPKIQVRESTIFFKIHTKIYQVDLRQIENIDVEFDTTMDEGASSHNNNNNNNNNNNKPPSLLIQFGNFCVFRMFRFDRTSPPATTATTAAATSSAADPLTALKGVQERLLQILLTGEGQVPSRFPMTIHSQPSANVGSPSGSSTTARFSNSGSSNSIHEPGQRDFSHRTPLNTTTTTTTTTTDDDSSAPPTTMPAMPSLSSSEKEAPAESSKPSGPEAEAEATARGTAATTATTSTMEDLTLQNPLAAYAQAQNNMQSLENGLFHPPPSSPTENNTTTSISTCTTNGTERSLEDHIRHGMAALPENLAASYCTNEELERAVRFQNVRMHGYQMELEGIVKSFWPTPKRRRRSEDDHISVDRRPQIPAAECIARVHALEAKHQKAMQEKLHLAFLPTRGPS